MPELFLQLLVASFVGLGAGYIGSYMILRRMSLVGDALSHVALPGIALAFIFHINPFIGAFSFLFLAVLGVWKLEQNTSLPSETLVGIFFTLSLALGLLLTPEPELLEALFGDISSVGSVDVLFILFLTPLIIFEMRRISGNLILGTLSPEIAVSRGVNFNFIKLRFLLLVALVVALGLKVVGTLLMGSLVIIPAAAAKNISSNLTRYTALSSLLGALSGSMGILVATALAIPPGPAVVLTGGIFFIFSLLFKKS